MSIIPGAFWFPQNGPQLTQEVPYRPYDLSLPTEQYTHFFSPLTMNNTAAVSQLPQRKAPRARRVSLTIFSYFQILSNVF